MLLYIFTGILPIREIYEKVDWPIIVLLGAMIPISSALETTGTSQLLATYIVDITQNLPNWLILAVIMIITMCLSDIINNAATALIMAPIASGIAMSLGVSIDPFLMAVAVWKPSRAFIVAPASGVVIAALGGTAIKANKGSS